MYIVRSGQVLGICFALHCLSFFTGTVSNRCIVHDLLQACTQRLLWLYAPGPHNALAAHNQSHKSARNISKQYTRLHSWPSQTETVFNQKHYWPLLWSESRCCFHGQCMVHGVFYCAGGGEVGVWHVSLEIGRKIRP